jgi:hypothetical protein
MKYIYLAGPVSGRPEKECLKHFDDVVLKITNKVRHETLDIETVNPVRFCEG